MPKKIEFYKNGGPEVLKYVDYELGSAKPPSDEIRIKHLSIGVNYIDTYHRTGLYPTKIPLTPGLEAVGEIVGVGDEVKNFNVGDRVGYASPPLGAYCEVRDFPAKNSFIIPSYIDDDSAASILLKGMTVEYLFNRTYKLRAGDVLLFHAAAGGVGLIACQWAKAVGCHLIGTVGSDEKIQLAKDNGCEYVINYTKDNVVNAVMDITKGVGVPVVYDGVGKDTLNISIDCLSKRGMFVSFGNASGMTPVVDLFKSFAPKNLYFTRPSLLIYNGSNEEIVNSSGLLFKMIKEKKIRANLSKTFRLENASLAHKELESRKTVGSLILKP